MKTIGRVVIAGWNLLRKPTTPVHLTFGLVCAFLCYAFGFLLGVALMIGFAIWEYWNDRELERCQDLCLNYGLLMKYHNYYGYYLPEGAMDFWEATVSFTIGLVALGVLQSLHIISISWLAGAM